jgi:hypothetical protein
MGGFCVRVSMRLRQSSDHIHQQVPTEAQSAVNTTFIPEAVAKKSQRFFLVISAESTGK